jgi:hypothetical protein
MNNAEEMMTMRSLLLAPIVAGSMAMTLLACSGGSAGDSEAAGGLGADAPGGASGEANPPAAAGAGGPEIKSSSGAASTPAAGTCPAPTPGPLPNGIYNGSRSVRAVDIAHPEDGYFTGNSTGDYTSVEVATNPDGSRSLKLNAGICNCSSPVRNCTLPIVPKGASWQIPAGQKCSLTCAGGFGIPEAKVESRFDESTIEFKNGLFQLHGQVHCTDTSNAPSDDLVWIFAK